MFSSKDVEKTIAFYSDIFGFKTTTDDPGADGGQVLHGDGCDLLVIPFNSERLPNPAHFAFEVNTVAEFDELLNKAVTLGLELRSEPLKNSKPGFGFFKRGLTRFKNFYISDPSGFNVAFLHADY